MARKKSKKKSTRRRHRVGAVNLKSVAMKIVAVGAGAFIGRTLQNMAVKQFPTASPKMTGLGIAVLGALTPKLVKGDIGQGVGDGILAVGTITALQSFGVINGIGRFPTPVKVIGNGAYNPNSSSVGAAYNKNASAVGQGANRAYIRDRVMGGAEREMMMGALLYED